MEFKNGVIAQLVAVWARPENGHFTTRMEIMGTKGIVEFNADDSISLQVLAAVSGDNSDSVAIPESPLDPRSNPYSREIIEFIRSVETETVPPIPVTEALESLNVVMATLESERVKNRSW